MKMKKGAIYEMPSEEINYPAGMKWTRQRKTVYKVLMEAEKPLNAAAIYSLVEKETEGGNYAPSTIYRILSFFEEQGLVEKETWMGDGTAVYSLNRGGHTHYAVCLECHRRFPLRSCPFSHIRMGEETENFMVTGHRLELYGYCVECRNKGQDCSRMEAQS